MCMAGFKVLGSWVRSGGRIQSQVLQGEVWLFPATMPTHTVVELIKTKTWLKQKCSARTKQLLIAAETSVCARSSTHTISLFIIAMWSNLILSPYHVWGVNMLTSTRSYGLRVVEWELPLSIWAYTDSSCLEIPYIKIINVLVNSEP